MVETGEQVAHAELVGGGETSKHSHAPPTGIPIVKYKSADETVNNSSVLQDDDHLFFDIAANEVWLVEFMLVISSLSATSDFKAALTKPVLASFYWKHDVAWAGVATTASPTILMMASADPIAVGSAALVWGLKLTAIVLAGAASFTLKLQWAQNTATAENTTVKKGSCLIAHKLS